MFRVFVVVAIADLVPWIDIPITPRPNRVACDGHAMRERKPRNSFVKGVLELDALAQQPGCYDCEIGFALEIRDGEQRANFRRTYEGVSHHGVEQGTHAQRIACAKQLFAPFVPNCKSEIA